MNLLLDFENAIRTLGYPVRSVFIILLVPLVCHAQYFQEHHIAPAPWQYWHNASEIVVSTNVDTTITVDILKSDGSFVTQLTLNSMQPGVFRPVGIFRDFPRHPLNTVLDGAGIFISGEAPFSVNVRNVASDQLGTDVFIKGNASLTSFGDPGIGLKFRIGYYRDGRLPGETPIYSIMALYDDTEVSLNGTKVCTLNKGQSFLFRSDIGSLVVSSKACVMNTGAFLDAPGGCGDGTFDQIPPIQVLGNKYFIVRTRGNRISEQSTVVGTEDQSWVRINRYDANGLLISLDSILLPTAGSFFTIANGDGTTPFSVTEVSSNQKIAIFSGSAQGCEVDVNTSFPVSSKCNGSNFIQTTKFKTYRNSDLPYFCYILLESDTALVDFNGSSIENLAGPRRQIGNSGLYMITCASAQLGNPDIITFNSTVRLQVVIIQIGGGFSMSAAFSNLVEQPVIKDPIFIGSHPCPIRSAILKVSSKYSNLQWYYNGLEIAGANDSVLIATESGNYHVQAFLDCGDITESIPLSITLDTLPQGITEKVSCGPFEWQDSIYTAEGTYTKVVKTDDGCDSLAILILDIQKPRSTMTSVTTCDKFLWPLNGKVYSETGLYSDTLKGRFDCDSIVFLDLTIYQSDTSETYISTCEPFYWSQTGQLYQATGTYADTLTNRFGCDSLLLLHLSIQGVLETNQSKIACDSFYWKVDGRTFYESGIYKDTLLSNLGCDSIVTLDLIVHHGIEKADTVKSCDPYYWEVTDKTYTATGLYTAQFSDQFGCDSIRYLDFTLNQSYRYSDTISALNQYYWPLTGQTYSQSGIYHKGFYSQAGCDSIHLLILTIRKRGQVFIPNVFTPNGDNINDRFVVYASSEIKQIDELLIYDRWGELVFAQYEFPPNIEIHGWDGFLNREAFSPAVFTYYASWLDGEGDPHMKTGSVTLVK